MFAEGLEKIDKFAFSESAVENVELPASLRKIAQGAFAKCKSLITVTVNEGLETLGENEYTEDRRPYCGVFEASAVERVMLPSTLKKIEYSAFKDCRSLKCIALPENLERIGRWCFQ